MEGICVMGVGNVLMGDDALGPYALASLEAAYEFPNSVTLFDAGTPGLDLTLFLEGLDALVVIDAVKANGRPGEVRLYDRDQLLRGGLQLVTSLHEPSLREALIRLDLIGRCPARIALVGVIPEKVATGTGLSGAVRAALPEVMRKVVETLEALDAKPAPRRTPRAPNLWWERAEAPEGGRRLRIRGTVQGVGFRPWVVRHSRERGLRGAVWNDAEGVVIEAFGPETHLDLWVEELRETPPPAARLTHFEVERIPAAPKDAYSGFDIRHSEVTSERRVTVPPDLPTCAACLAELRDEGDRRYRYPFINCTCCGPRYTIVTGLPYDRPETTMASFSMCPDCQAEYDRVEDRRFHAQPNACPVCGPRLTLVDSSGRPVAAADPIRAVVEALEAGKVVALKGLGGFHLAVDATNPDAVQLLRDRKRRDEKPFAVMVKDLEAARALADLNEAEASLLCGVERPIVLARRLRGSAVAPNVSPGLERVGLMLPYTPLHHLLFDPVTRAPPPKERGSRALVMTSGNLSDEPIARTNEEALSRLGMLCDLVLLHDRDIEARADDSVAQVVAEGPQLLRRSRGYVSRGTPLPVRLSQPVLATGALLKNTFCLASGDVAYLGAHVGDLENLETLCAFEEGVARMERLLQIRPEVIAHDLHPEYLSTAYARGREGVVRVGVQHHHAHVVSAMVQHGLAGEVLGLAWDGTGHGPDGTAWGSELLRVDTVGFERLATFRPLRIAGGDRAIKDVWRIALAALDDAFDGDPPLDRLPLFDQVSAAERAGVRQMIKEGLNAPWVHGAGRYFDAVGALVLGRRAARYEGQLAMTLEQTCDATERRPYRFQIDCSRRPFEVDLRPTLRDAVRELAQGRAPGTVAARFHETLVSVAAELAQLAQAGLGPLPVVLTGGCFQNARLAGGVKRALAFKTRVLTHGEIPAGDGGLAVGQVVIADALLKAGAKEA